MATRRPFARLLSGILTENLPFKAIAVVSALAVWAWVQSGEVIDTRTRAEVIYAMPESKGLVVARQVPKSVVVTLSGPQGVVRRLSLGDLELDVDLRESEEGTVPVDFTELELRGLPAGVEVVQVSPPAVEVEFDRALTREVQVQPSTIGEPADGWRLVSVEVEPASVEITGPQGTVRDISEVPTDIIEIAGRTEDLDIQVALLPRDKVVEVAEGSPTSVMVRVDIEPIVAQRTFEEVPVMVRGGTDWIPDPRLARVTLRGPQAMVGAVSLDRVSVVLQAPEEAPEDGQVRLSWRAGAVEPTVDVVHDQDRDLVEVVAVEPRAFGLEVRR